MASFFVLYFQDDSQRIGSEFELNAANLLCLFEQGRYMSAKDRP